MQLTPEGGPFRCFYVYLRLSAAEGYPFWSGKKKAALKNAKYPLDTQYYVLYSIMRKGAFNMLDPQMKRGLLEACVLSALAREDSYGYKIVKDLSVCVQVSESTLYPILRRLENAGALTVYSVEHNSRLRKFYHLTEQGRQQLADAVRDWKELESMYDFIRGGLRS